MIELQIDWQKNGYAYKYRIKGWERHINSNNLYWTIKALTNHLWTNVKNGSKKVEGHEMLVLYKVQNIMKNQSIKDNLTTNN